MVANMKRAIAIAAFLFFILPENISYAATSVGKPTEAKAPYTFAVIPFYTPEKIWALYTPFIDYLKKSTGQPWELKLYSNHDELIEGVCSGKVSAALLGPVPLGRANSRCGVKPLLAALGKDGKPDYHAVILTNSPAVKSLKDLKGNRFGFFKGSTAAHILPAKMLKDAGVSMADIQPVFLESQDKIMTALLSGELSGAGVKENLAKKFANTGVRSVAISQPLPNFAISVTPSFPPAARQRLVTSLVRLKPLSNGADAEAMKEWDDEIKNGFITPDKEFLPAVTRIFDIFTEIQGSKK